jgi:acetylornithine deacetylase/succinyl-diaminopimelate desuccinylase-like protein
MQTLGPTAAELESMLWDVVKDLQAVIRLESVNPPGNELVVARYVHDLLHRHGVESHLYEPAPGRGIVIARVRGTGEQPPLLLMAHMDVVGVEREKWITPPFGGEVLDGYVYGRGAIDDKGMLMTNLHAVLWLQKHVSSGYQPTRDVVFLATSDEEAGGDHGIDWVMEHHRDQITAGVALNEGGRVRVIDGVPAYAAVQCAEKVPYNVFITARGSGGHAAVPHDGNAIVRLARALARISAHREPLALFDVTRGFFGELASVWPSADVQGAMADLASGDPVREARGAEGLRHIPSLDAVLRTGISPTLVSGGTRSNVIPTEAEATLNIRIMPGGSLDELLGRLRALVDDPVVEFRLKSSGLDAPASSPDSPEYRAIVASLQAVHPGLAVAPYLSTGATDSATLRHAGIPCYGLLPFPLTQEDEDRMHGHDERVRIDALSFGLAVTCGIVSRLTSRAA